MDRTRAIEFAGETRAPFGAPLESKNTTRLGAGPERARHFADHFIFYSTHLRLQTIRMAGTHSSAMTMSQNVIHGWAKHHSLIARPSAPIYFRLYARSCGRRGFGRRAESNARRERDCRRLRQQLKGFSLFFDGSNSRLD
jgi:hypothetical protein